MFRSLLNSRQSRRSTALFSTPYAVPSSSSPSTITPLDFGKPVLDFVLVPNEALALVILDPTWSPEGEATKALDDARRVRLVNISSSGEVGAALCHHLDYAGG